MNDYSPAWETCLIIADNEMRRQKREQAIIDKNEFDTMVERGSKAWADVGSATEFIEDLRGNTKEK